MGATITWIPFGASTAKTLDFAPWGIQRLSGGHEADREVVHTPAGRAVVQWIDSWDTYELHVDAIHRIDDANWIVFENLLPFLVAYGEFSFAADSNKDSETTLSAGAAEAASSISVVSTSGFSAGDTIMIEHVTDARQIMTAISGPPGGGTMNISPLLYSPMPTGSKVRHFQYFPKCRAEAASFTERDAGLGANLWDFRVRFRTFRG